MGNQGFESNRETHLNYRSRIARPSPSISGKKKYWDDELRCWFIWRDGVNPEHGLREFKYYHTQYNERGNK